MGADGTPPKKFHPKVEKNVVSFKDTHDIANISAIKMRKLWVEYWWRISKEPVMLNGDLYMAAGWCNHALIQSKKLKLNTSKNSKVAYELKYVQESCDTTASF